MTLRDAWQAHAQDWLAWARRPGHDGFWQTIQPPLLELLPAAGRLTVDVGCGEGRLSRELQRRGHRVLGIDIAPALVQATLAGGTPAIQADAAALPLTAGAADLVVACMSLQDIDDLDGAIHEISRVLTPGGALCLAIVHPLSSAGRFTTPTATAPFVIEDSYLDETVRTQHVERDGLPMTFVSAHRPLGRYFQTLEAAGLHVVALREPAVPGSAVAANPTERRWQRIPEFLLLRAFKPRERRQ